MGTQARIEAAERSAEAKIRKMVRHTFGRKSTRFAELRWFYAADVDELADHLYTRLHQGRGAVRMSMELVVVYGATFYALIRIRQMLRAQILPSSKPNPLASEGDAGSAASKPTENATPKPTPPVAPSSPPSSSLSSSIAKRVDRLQTPHLRDQMRFLANKEPDEARQILQEHIATLTKDADAVALGKRMLLQPTADDARNMRLNELTQIDETLKMPRDFSRSQSSFMSYLFGTDKSAEKRQIQQLMDLYKNADNETDRDVISALVGKNILERKAFVGTIKHNADGFLVMNKYQQQQMSKRDHDGELLKAIGDNQGLNALIGTISSGQQSGSSEFVPGADRYVTLDANELQLAEAQQASLASKDASHQSLYVDMAKASKLVRLSEERAKELLMQQLNRDENAPIGRHELVNIGRESASSVPSTSPDELFAQGVMHVLRQSDLDRDQYLARDYMNAVQRIQTLTKVLTGIRFPSPKAPKSVADSVTRIVKQMKEGVAEIGKLMSSVLQSPATVKEFMLAIRPTLETQLVGMKDMAVRIAKSVDDALFGGASTLLKTIIEMMQGLLRTVQFLVTAYMQPWFNSFVDTLEDAERLVKMWLSGTGTTSFDYMMNSVVLLVDAATALVGAVLAINVFNTVYNIVDHFRGNTSIKQRIVLAMTDARTATPMSDVVNVDGESKYAKARATFDAWMMTRRRRIAADDDDADENADADAHAHANASSAEFLQTWAVDVQKTEPQKTQVRTVFSALRALRERFRAGAAREADGQAQRSNESERAIRRSLAELLSASSNDLAELNGQSDRHKGKESASSTHRMQGFLELDQLYRPKTKLDGGGGNGATAAVFEPIPLKEVLDDLSADLALFFAWSSAERVQANQYKTHFANYRKWLADLAASQEPVNMLNATLRAKGSKVSRWPGFGLGFSLGWGATAGGKASVGRRRRHGRLTRRRRRRSTRRRLRGTHARILRMMDKGWEGGREHGSFV